ncbi:histone-lysine N-methyltransferase SETMAR [Plakobranchus ocellatus]|uniref:Histone-lysine N-methyltransferase SETMAR n=1 Tax=Plakobranchus ocellatus TaxID=259542 RepID=A0AAV4CWQ8_9GAST|nr:histone-lysine N-methyltransferase SETMAR [Plakobranchus ocellatus]
MAPRHLVCIWTLVLALGLSGARPRYGFIMTMPLVLRSNTPASFCIIMHGTIGGQRPLTLAFTTVQGGKKLATITRNITIDVLYCGELLLPPPGYYKFTVHNSWWRIHDDPVKVTVLDSDLILIQTDKPIYKPGEKGDEPKSVRPKTSTNEENTTRVDGLIRCDRRMKIREIALKLEIPKSTVHEIVHDTLGYRKVSARWVPKMLTEDHKLQRVEISQRLLQRCQQDNGDEDTTHIGVGPGGDFQANNNLFDNLITGDETWVQRQSATP